MDALLMCGGRGTRLDADAEKPLLEVAGRPMADRVRAALAASRVRAVHAVCSPHAPRTRAHLDGECRVLDAPGEGYVADLNHALARVDPPVLSVAADLPLLTGAAVDAVLDAHGEGPLTVAVPAALKRRLGVSLDTATTVTGRPVAPTGVNVVADGRGTEGGDGGTLVSEDRRLAVNVNRPRDARIAEVLA